jgi:hypothetical protein
MTTKLWILDKQNKRYELIKLIEVFDPVCKWFQFEPIKYEVLLYYWILYFLRIPTRYYLLFFELQIKSYEFYKIQFDSGLKFLFGSGLNREPTRGVSW